MQAPHTMRDAGCPIRGCHGCAKKWLGPKWQRTIGSGKLGATHQPRQCAPGRRAHELRSPRPMQFSNSQAPSRYEPRIGEGKDHPRKRTSPRSCPPPAARCPDQITCRIPASTFPSPSPGENEIHSMGSGPSAEISAYSSRSSGGSPCPPPWRRCAHADAHRQDTWS